MLAPKRTKFRKAFKGRIHGNAKGGVALNFGAYGLKAIEPARVTARQIEAARRAITRHIRREGRVWIRIFPDVPVSVKPAEVRMGSGKGSPEYWVCRVSLVASCLSLTECHNIWQKKLLVWLRQSCQIKCVLSNDWVREVKRL